MSKLTRVQYGSVKMLSGICPECQRSAFILDGKYACCDHPAPEGLKIVAKKRVESVGVFKRKNPSKGVQKRKLEAQENRCFYCDQKFGTLVWRHKRPLRLRVDWDHLVPFSFGQDNSRENFVAACQFCNRWKTSTMFENIKDVRRYVATRWRKLGYECPPHEAMPSLSDIFLSESRLAGILHPQLSDTALALSEKAPLFDARPANETAPESCESKSTEAASPGG